MARRGAARNSRCVDLLGRLRFTPLDSSTETAAQQPAESPQREAALALVGSVLLARFDSIRSLCSLLSLVSMLIPPLNWGLVEKGLSRSAVPLALNFDFLTQQRIKTIVWLRDEGGNNGPAAAAADAAFVAFVNANNIELIQLGGTKTGEDDDDDDEAAAEQQIRDAAVAAAIGPKDAAASAATAANPPMTKQPSSTSIAASAAASVASGSWKPTSEALVLQALRLVLDPRAYPLHLVCSGTGRHRTGVVVGCFRKLQRWALSSIFAEYRRYAGSTGLRGADDVGNQMVMNEQFIELFDIELLQPEMESKGNSKHLKTIHVPVAAATATFASFAQSQSASKDDFVAQQQRRLHAGVQSQIAAAAAAAAASSARAIAAASAVTPSPAPAVAAPTATSAPAATAAAASLAPAPRPSAAPAANAADMPPAAH